MIMGLTSCSSKTGGMGKSLSRLAERMELADVIEGLLGSSFGVRGAVAIEDILQDVWRNDRAHGMVLWDLAGISLDRGRMNSRKGRTDEDAMLTCLVSIEGWLDLVNERRVNYFSM